MSRLMISDLKINDSVGLPAIIKETSARKTKAGKPYLFITCYDGQATLSGNYWDWKGKAMPEVNNTVYTIMGQVTEYQGQKQINVSGILTNTDYKSIDFMPSSGVDLQEYFNKALDIAKAIDHDVLSSVAVDLLYKYENLWLSIPGAKGVHHAFVGGTLVHSVSVAQKAIAIAESMSVVANKELIAFCALMHDIGKLWTYEFDGPVIGMTTAGVLKDHLHMGAIVISNALAKDEYADTVTPALIDLVEHVILAHHGELEKGAVVTPACLEAWVVHYADAIDATAQMITEAINVPDAMWTDKVWALNNRPMLTPSYIHDTLYNSDKRNELPFK